ncbi:MAG: RRP8 family class I SAM-dependent methyltransferase, partial [Actinomycetota bacterium]|nr:RRP8 family class I SAM-dependent methyltransferase [Actinomycetota bacterium]
VPLPPELRERVRIRVGDFTTINNRWVSSNSGTVHERLKADPSEWYLYHTLYREAREAWPELPAEHIASYLRGRPDWKVGDFGCGECLLKKALPDHEIIGLDHVAIDDSVIACDMAHAPLEDESLGAAVFSLSLMGRNWPAYLAEAHRTLRPFGLLFVAEPARRWEEGRLEQAVEEHGFETLPSYQRGDFRYVRAVKGLPPSSYAL